MLCKYFSIFVIYFVSTIGGENKKWYILDLCVSSLRRGHANLLCIVPILADDLFRGSTYKQGPGFSTAGWSNIMFLRNSKCVK